MKRNFDNFLSAYLAYAKDGFVPDRFHLWTGLSILAGALERKVTLQQRAYCYFPNIYVMLVSHPKGGKSTAIDRGVDIIEGLTRDIYNPNFRIIPQQTTEAAFVKRMGIVDQIQIPGTTKFFPQSAGYFYASEASFSALQNTHGDFVATMTAMYDCPKVIRKDLVSLHEPLVITNPCMNMLAGATFNYLKTLVNEVSVMGGFASRVLYVVSSERKVRRSKWDDEQPLDPRMRERLIEDLATINKLMGPMKPSPEWKAKFEEWQAIFDQSIIDLNSERLESIMARKDMNVIKVSMLLSIAEGDSFVLTGEHFDQALALVDDVYKDFPSILSAAAMADKTSQSGLNELITQTISKKGGNLPLKVLKAMILKNGNDLDRVNKTIDYMLESGHLGLVGGQVKLLVNPDTQL